MAKRADNSKNLTPIQKGQVLNPYGRRGKDGTGGVSLKALMSDMLAKMTPDERENLLSGVLRKAGSGDVQALKLIAQMNSERIDEPSNISVNVDEGVRIQIAIPPKNED